MKIKDAIAIIGGNISKGNKKILAPDVNLPAISSCQVGTELSKVIGSVCYECYAQDGNFRYENVQDSLHRRLDRVMTYTAMVTVKDGEIMLGNASEYVEAMATILRARINEYKKVRFHSSGDIVSMEHLAIYISICESMPDVSFWLPTKQLNWVLALLRNGIKIPDNLCIRLSGYMTNDHRSIAKWAKIPLKGSVHSDYIGLTLGDVITFSTSYDSVENIPSNAVDCPAIRGKNHPKTLSCVKACSACWDKGTSVTGYLSHGTKHDSKFRQQFNDQLIRINGENKQ